MTAKTALCKLFIYHILPPFPTIRPPASMAELDYLQIRLEAPARPAGAFAGLRPPWYVERSKPRHDRFVNDWIRVKAPWVPIRPTRGGHRCSELTLCYISHLLSRSGCALVAHAYLDTLGTLPGRASCPLGVAYMAPTSVYDALQGGQSPDTSYPVAASPDL